MQYKSLPFFAFVGLSLGLSACGKNVPKTGMVDHVDARIQYDASGAPFVGVDAVLNTGNLYLPHYVLPVEGGAAGAVELNPLLGKQKSTLAMSVSLAALAGKGRAARSLPNGAELPWLDVAGAAWNEVAVGNVGESRVYWGGAPARAWVGVAIPIRDFEQIQNLAPGKNLAWAFTAGPGNSGLTGIFAGAVPQTTGLFLFVELAAAGQGLVLGSGSGAGAPTLRVNISDDGVELGEALPLAARAPAAAAATPPSSVASVPPRSWAPSGSQQRRLGNGLSRMNARARVLRLY